MLSWPDLHAAGVDTGLAGSGLAGVEEEGRDTAGELLGALPVQVNVATGGLQAGCASQAAAASLHW